jgi:hypothetical protein
MKFSLSVVQLSKFSELALFIFLPRIGVQCGVSNSVSDSEAKADFEDYINESSNGIIIKLDDFDASTRQSSLFKIRKAICEITGLKTFTVPKQVNEIDIVVTALETTKPRVRADEIRDFLINLRYFQ